ncbi:hypothetical protein [Oceanispirochaeta sp. M1]|uniref:hypothetical protein n=1 Tax=Oceanispirochaeta sp. M1 TaxID=2283433 RepID=UPI00149529A2|nr:hypothetical protein [Oceanispirochaeta sp. M1]
MKIKTKNQIISLFLLLLFSCKGAVDPPVLDDSEGNDGLIAPDLEYSIIYNTVEFSLDLSLINEIPADT